MARDSLESQSDGRHGSRDPEVFPLWDPSQLLATSQLLLLKAATFQAGDDGSGSDDATSVTSEGEFGSRYRHLITPFDMSVARQLEDFHLINSPMWGLLNSHL